MSSTKEQYAVLLNGWLVGDTPFVFESREAVERLVRLLGDLTGARASAVQRGWCRDDAPPFDLRRVSGWLDRHGPSLVRPGHQMPAEAPEVALPDLVWPLDAWEKKRPDSPYRGWTAVGFSFPPFDELPLGAEHASSLDGPDGSLYDIFVAAHDLDDWEERGSTYQRSTSIELAEGWIDAADLDLLYGSRPPRPASLEPDDGFEWLDPPRQTTAGAVRKAGQYAEPHTQPPALSETADSYALRWGGEVLGGVAYQFRSRPEMLQLLRHLHGLLPGPVTAAVVGSGEEATAFSPAHLASWFREHVTDPPEAAAALRECYGLPLETEEGPAPELAAHAYLFQIQDDLLCSLPIGFENRAQASALRQAVSLVLRTSVVSQEVTAPGKVLPLDLQAVTHWLMEHRVVDPERLASLQEEYLKVLDRETLPVAGAHVPAQPAVHTYIFEVAQNMVGGGVLTFSSADQATALRQALSEALRVSVCSSLAQQGHSGTPFDLPGLMLWLTQHGWPAQAVASLPSTYARLLQRTAPPPVSPGKTGAPTSRGNVSREQALRRMVEERGIQHLMHFTRVDNLPGIRDQGLISRAMLGDDGCVWNDALRLDRRPQAICLSVSYPNYKMFYNYRQQGGVWAVLLLDPCLLWELDCGFVEVNAASSGVPSRSQAELRSPAAFERMFGQDDLRRTLHLPPHYTTNPQAEVLVLESIHPTFIQEIHVDFVMKEPLVLACDDHIVPIKTDSTFFRGRHDYEHWRAPILS